MTLDKFPSYRFGKEPERANRPGYEYQIVTYNYLR